jgi:hypothetical protein
MIIVEFPGAGINTLASLGSSISTYRTSPTRVTIKKGTLHGSKAHAEIYEAIRPQL